MHLHANGQTHFTWRENLISDFFESWRCNFSNFLHVLLQIFHTGVFLCCYTSAIKYCSCHNHNPPRLWNLLQIQFTSHCRFPHHGQVQWNLIPSLLKQFNRSVWAETESSHLGILGHRKITHYWRKNGGFLHNSIVNVGHSFGDRNGPNKDYLSKIPAVVVE